MSTQIIYSDEFSKHDNRSHPENAERLKVMLDEIKKSQLYEDLIFIEPEILPEKILYDIHSKRMIEQIKEISNENNSWLDFDTYVCKSDYETARLAAGGLLSASNNVIKGKVDNAFALIRPPGHHATRDRSMGFCLFNNIAIAANEISKLGKKILIFDFDVHHGNGTQDIFYDRKDVLYQSFHLSPHYPGTGDTSEIGTEDGEGYTVNIPVSHGNGNNAISKTLDEVFLPIAKQFKPDIIMYSTGYDSHHLDPLGGLKLSSHFYGEIIEKFREVQPKNVCTLEGGYNLNWLGKCLVSQIGKMVGKDIDFKDTAVEVENVNAVIKEIKDEMSRYWKI
jgi:acetoin utilization deacetylase AcuC-like enzyme